MRRDCFLGAWTLKRFMVLVAVWLLVALPAVRADDDPLGPPTEKQTEKPAQKPADSSPAESPRPEPPVPAELLYDMPPLAGVDWISPPVNLDALYGQTLVVVFVETWCGICNGWAPPYSRQLASAAAEQPVTIIYLGVDVSKVGFKQYLNKYNIKGHAAGVTTKTLAREFGFANTLWQSVVVNPRGERVYADSFGRYYAKPEGKRHVISTKLAEYCAGATAVVTGGGSSRMKKVDLAVRLGHYGAALKALKKAGEKGQETRQRLLKRGQEILQAARAYEDSAPYLSYRLAGVVAREFKREDMAATATELVARLSKNKTVLSGKAGDRKLVQLNNKARRQPNPKAIDKAFQMVARRYKNCRAGRVAKQALMMPLDTDFADK